MDSSTIVFLLLAIAAWGTGAFFDKACLRYMAPTGAFYVRTLFLILTFAPFLVWKYVPTKQALLGANKFGLLFVLCSEVISMAGVFFFMKALSVGEATKIVPLSSTYPAVTFVLALLFLGENFTAGKFIGTLLISGGIYFISK